LQNLKATVILIRNHPTKEVVMKVYVSVKQVGKKKEYISNKSCEIPDNAPTLADLIRYIVTKQVEAYNKKEPGSDVVALLTQEGINIQIQTGKIGFNRRYGKDANIHKAVEAALLAFSDGLYRVFIDENEVTA